MYSSNSTDYQRYLTSPPKPEPAPSFSFSQPADGIPVSSSDHSYSQSQQHQPVRPQSKPKEPWSTGLCDCLDDVPNCCVTLWCPCITFGRIAEIIDKGSTSCGTGGALYTLIACVTACPCCYSCFYRAKMRQQYALHESPCGDCLVHCFCESCALCQEFRELRSRGFDMTIGWHGNMENHHREIAMAPKVEEGMSR